MFTKQSYTLQFNQGLPVKGKSAHSESFQEIITSSILASTATDNCTAHVTVSNDVALPISKQGTFRVTSAHSNDHNIATNHLKKIVIKGVVEPVPSATNSHYQHNHTSISSIRIQSETVPVQFFDALGRKVPVLFEATSGLFDVYSVFSGHNRIRIKSNYSGFR